jgi:hypothetical protein
MLEPLLVSYYLFKVVGYILALWTAILGTGLNFTLFDFPTKMPMLLVFYPAFNITRILYYLCISCGYKGCVASMSEIPDEIGWCVAMLYISAAVFTILGIYLYEVIPQQYGVRKSPFFCIEGLIKKIKNKFSKNKHTHVNDEAMCKFFIISKY